MSFWEIIQREQEDPWALPRPGSERQDRRGLQAEGGDMAIVLLALVYAPGGTAAPDPGGGQDLESGGGHSARAVSEPADERVIVGIERLVAVAAPDIEPAAADEASRLVPRLEEDLTDEAAEAVKSYIADKVTDPGWTVISEHWPVQDAGAFGAAEDVMSDVQDEIHELALGKPAELITQSLDVPGPVSGVLERVAAEAPLPGDQSLGTIVRAAEVIAVTAATAAGQYHLACAWAKPLAHDALTTVVRKAIDEILSEPVNRTPRLPEPEPPEPEPPEPGRPGPGLPEL